MENKELKFAASLEEARELAKVQGNVISSEQVKGIFASLDLSDEQYGFIYEYFKKNKIGLDEAVNLDDYLSGEEKEFLRDYLTLFSSQNETPFFMKDIIEIAKFYVGQGVALEDLIGEGNVVLAANPGVMDEGLLAGKIRAAMEGLIAEAVRNRESDKQMVEIVNAIADDAKELNEAFGRKVTVLELADEGKYTVEEIIEAISMAGEDLRDIIG